MKHHIGVAWYRRLLPAWLAAWVVLSWLPHAHASDIATQLRDAGAGHVLLLRHMVTEPGFGDPAGFDLADCRTQRNLSDQGRDDARQLGDRLRALNVPIRQVRTSAWCRCRESAELAVSAYDASLPVTEWAPLNSFFQMPQRRAAQVAAMQAAAADPPADGHALWVTHQVNITALTGIVPAMGEIVVVRPTGERFEVVGRWKPLDD